MYQWLRRQPGEFAIVELPIVPSDGYFRRPAFDATICMVYSMLPGSVSSTATPASSPPPSQEFLDHMRRLKLRYVVMHRRGFGPFKWGRVERDMPRFEAQLRRVEQFADDTVFEILPAPCGRYHISS